jgi:hypothetical protein
MKSFLVICIAIGFVGCQQNNKAGDKNAVVENSGKMVALAFAEHSLKGNFDQAEKLMLRDSANEQAFDRFLMSYNGLPAEKKDNFKSASVIVNSYEVIKDDSLAIFNYKNSYTNQPIKLKMIKVNGQWQVDFKYTLDGNL